MNKALVRAVCVELIMLIKKYISLDKITDARLKSKNHFLYYMNKNSIIVNEKIYLKN